MSFFESTTVSGSRSAQSLGSELAHASTPNSLEDTGLGDDEQRASYYKATISEAAIEHQWYDPSPVADEPNMWCVER